MRFHFPVIIIDEDFRSENTSAKAGKKGLWQYIRSVLITLVRLPLILVTLVIVGYLGNYHLVKYRANTFCDSFAIGAPFDLAKFEAQARQIPSTSLHIYPALFSGGSGTVWVQFREIVPEYHTCSLGIVDGIVVTREVQFRN